MDVVKQFLECRRKGDAEGAIKLLEPDATLGGPWGYRYGAGEYEEYLHDEKSFSRREYLADYKLEEIAPNTFQRKFEYDRGMHQHQFMRSHYFTGWFRFLPIMRRSSYYREVYWVNGDKLRLVTCHMQP
jgi:hypothetical protein